MTVLWDKLRGRQLGEYKFKRQRVFGRFILDFYCPECKLVIELDGEIHQRQQEHDAQRTEQLQYYGVTVLRFNNQDVIEETDKVLVEILVRCKELVHN